MNSICEHAFFRASTVLPLAEFLFVKVHCVQNLREHIIFKSRLLLSTCPWTRHWSCSQLAWQRLACQQLPIGVWVCVNGWLRGHCKALFKCVCHDRENITAQPLIWAEQCYLNNGNWGISILVLSLDIKANRTEAISVIHGFKMKLDFSYVSLWCFIKATPLICAASWIAGLAAKQRQHKVGNEPSRCSRPANSANNRGCDAKTKVRVTHNNPHHHRYRPDSQLGLLNAPWNTILDDNISGRHMLRCKGPSTLMYSARLHTWRPEKWVTRPTETQPVPITDVEISRQHQAAARKAALPNNATAFTRLCKPAGQGRIPPPHLCLLCRIKMTTASGTGVRWHP